MNTSVTRLDACQSLLVSPSNSTVTTWLTMASRAVMPRSPAPCVGLGTDSVVTNAQVQEAPAAWQPTPPRGLCHQSQTPRGSPRGRVQSRSPCVSSLPLPRYVKASVEHVQGR